MSPQLTTLFQALAGLIAGSIIGIVFGMIQAVARRRNERLQQSGKLRSAWAVMPGSGRRVAGLVIALALVQVFCPLLFVNSSQWWVSGGVVAGYGALLFRQLRQRQLRGLH